MTNTRPDQAVSRDDGTRSLQPEQQAFAQVTAPYRRQIKAYCYRMTGSLHEAEDLTQETLLKAWRAFDSLRGQDALKAWLYRIATRVCLDALRQRKHTRRMLPEAEFSAATSLPDGQPKMGVDWVEPYPDAELDEIAEAAPGPEARYEQDESVRLAFVAAIQFLPPRQRAVLLLIDVIGWSAGETTTLIGGSTASINSALQRARTTLVRHYPAGDPHRRGELGIDQTALLDRYVRVWEAKDLDGFIALLKEDALYSMPPLQHWYRGRSAIHRFFAAVWQHYGRFRLLPTGANRQPAFVLYTRDDTGGAWTVHSIHMLALRAGAIAKLTLFVTPMSPGLAEAFGFPATLVE